MSEPFVVNVADARAVSYEGSGVYVPFEDPDNRFPDFGINIHMLSPGEPSAKYHAESVQGHRPDQAARASSSSYARSHFRIALSETPLDERLGRGDSNPIRLSIQSAPCCQLHHSPAAL
jgi:hypothetical protein